MAHTERPDHHADGSSSFDDQSRKWAIDGHEVKMSKRPHNTCCACNCIVDLIRELRAKIAELEGKEDIMSGEGP